MEEEEVKNKVGRPRKYETKQEVIKATRAVKLKSYYKHKDKYSEGRKEYAKKYYTKIKQGDAKYTLLLNIVKQMYDDDIITDENIKQYKLPIKTT